MKVDVYREEEKIDPTFFFALGFPSILFHSLLKSTYTAWIFPFMCHCRANVDSEEISARLDSAAQIPKRWVQQIPH